MTDDQKLEKSKRALDLMFKGLLNKCNAEFLAGPPPTHEYYFDHDDGKMKLRPITEQFLMTIPREQYMQLHERAVYWQDKYNRDVEGLNNEGDAIGGEPPSGLRHRIEYLAKENERLKKMNKTLYSMLPPEGELNNTVDELVASAWRAIDKESSRAADKDIAKAWTDAGAKQS